MTENTGRLNGFLRPELRDMLFGEPDSRPGWKDELRHITEIDLAHVLMLAEEKIIAGPAARILLPAIGELRASDFAGLEDWPRPRGLYLGYESWLVERLGADVGGVLHTGRSRNDLNATALAMALRQPFEQMARETLALGELLLDRAQEYRDVVMPAYTHYQPAVPITFGHYLIGVSSALSREAGSLLHAGGGLDRCPLGAGAVGGTTLPIRPGRTAALLGFTGPVLNSVDAVASRDTVLRLVGAAALLGVLLDRVAHDLLLWTTAEFSLLAFPDDLVGSSSMMPQKRNPFVLEHLAGKSAAAAGALAGAIGAMRGSPFTNSIATGTEAVRLARAGFGPVTDALRIMRLSVAGLRPAPEKMAARAEAGLTGATALAEGLVQAGIPFRSAHFEVGAAARDVIDGRRATIESAVAARVAGPPAAAAGSGSRTLADYGGGPGPHSFARAMSHLRTEWHARGDTLEAAAGRWARASGQLEHEVDMFMERGQ